jgi:hypothetical protein
MPSTIGGRSRRLLRALTVLALLAAGAWAVIITGPLILGAYPHTGGCGEGPTNPNVTQQLYPGSYQFPYGDVSDCRELGRESQLFSTNQGVDLLLTTQKGLVAIRVDYKNLDAGRQYTAEATELAASDVASGLSNDERARLAADIAARGGVRPSVWVLHYGDG